MKYYIKKYNGEDKVYKIPQWFIDFIKSQETFSPVAYKDNTGYSVGYGSQTMLNGKPTKAGDKMTEKEATQALENYIYKNIPDILKVHPNFYNYPEQTQSAIIDIVYRGGIGALRNSKGFNTTLTNAMQDNYVSSEELKRLEKEMGYNRNGSIYGANGRKGARILMLAGMYDPNYNKLINRSAMPNPYKIYDNMENIVERTKSNPHQNFVQRLNQENRMTIPDWENSNNYATHKLGWYYDPKANKDVVFPLVQELPTSFLGIPTGTEMVDFTDPRVNKGKNQFDLGIESAIQNNDTLQVNPGMGQYYTTQYKHFYPEFKKGGSIHIKEKNKGKFTESAKRAGKSVQEHARDVINNPKATKLQKKRAQFALNAKKFKHD